MSRQAADLEMKTIRRILDAIEALPTPAMKARVLKYVAERANEPEPQLSLALAGQEATNRP